MKGARLLIWLALGFALGVSGVHAWGQTLTAPLPPGCTAPTISGTTVSCGAVPPPVCPVPPPTCPAQPPAGCPACMPPVPPASCGSLTKMELGQFYFDGSTQTIQLGKGDREVAIMWYVATVADIGKVSHLNIAEHGSGAHQKTIWASRVKCEMNNTSRVASDVSPSAWVSVDGTQRVNMQPGETWYFMIRNLTSTGKNSCSDTKCGEIISKYLWAPAAGVMSYKAPKFKAKK